MTDPGREIATLDATAQARLVASGQCAPHELVEAAIARVEAFDPDLNAVIHPELELALQRATSGGLPRGPFRGVPLLLKDVECHVEGQPMHYGMRFLKDRQHRATFTTELARRFLAAGFAILGRTNTPELGTSPTTEPRAYGPTRNPWNLAYSPGGSSGGSAAAVAAGLAPVAHATDGGGSIRMPASACGLVGLKPSRGRVSFAPGRAEGWGGLLCSGVLTRSVRDTASILDAVAGPASGDPYVAPAWRTPLRSAAERDPPPLRIGVRELTAGSRRRAHRDCRGALERASALLADLGHAVEEAAPGALDEPEVSLAYGVITGVTTAREIDRWERHYETRIGPADVEPWNWMLVEHGRQTSAVELVRAHEALQVWSRRVCAWWAGGFDLLLTPTLTHPPAAIGEIAPELPPIEMAALRERFGGLTPPWNMTGQPAISLPAGRSHEEDLPIGVQLVAPAGREDLLVQIAGQLERAALWDPTRIASPRARTQRM